MEFEVRTLTTIETCFVSLPLTLIQTLQSGYLPPVLAVELSSDARVWHVAWCGAASSSSSIEIARQYADCIGLIDGAFFKVRVLSNVPKAELVTCEPLTEDDWEILELNSELAESSILKQVGIVHEDMKFPLWLHGRTIVTFLVVSTIPQKPVVQLVPGSEVAVAPKRRKNTSRISPDEDCTNIKALLRVQDLNNSIIYEHEENGIKMEVVPTSCIYIHPETAERYSFSSLQLVTIYPRSLSKESLKMLHRKRSGMEKDAKDGNLTDTQGHQLVLRLLLSKSVANGHIMLSQSLRFYLGIAVHTWVHVKQCNISVKKDFSLVSLSPYHFKVFRNDEGTERSDLELIKDHENQRSKDAPQGIDSNTLIGITDWSIHEKFMAALSVEHSQNGVEETTTKTGEAVNKFGRGKGISALLHAWCLAQFVSSSAENTKSLILGRKTLLHLRVKNCQLRRHAIVQRSKYRFLKNIHQAEDQSFDILYVLSLSEESMHAADNDAYELAFDKYDNNVLTSRSLDILLGKLQLGDILSSSIASQLNPDNDIHDVIPSLDWMGTAPVDVNHRLSVLLSPTAGTIFYRYNLPLPGHVLICGSPGSGKTLLAKVSAKSIEGCKDILAHVVFVSCSRLTLEKPSMIRQTLSRYISEALDCAPSIIILDDLDSLVASSSDLDGSQPSSSSAALIEFLADLLDEYGDKRRMLCGMGPIAFLATSHSLTSIPPSLSSSGRFDFHIKLPVPAAAERSAILRHEIQKRSLQCHADILLDIASKCDGYDAYDLEILVDRSVHTAIGRTLSSERGSEENDRSDLVREDFLEAMKDFLPVAMRDLTKPITEGGRSGWNDVGGLNNIQIAIREMIELPSKFPNIFAQAPLRLRSNVLLYGPPGCGKTHIVGAAAAACSLRFISVKGPELLNKYIGASEQAVRDIFSKAAAAAPCLLFFDEFDSIAPKRGHDNTGVTDRVVNQFLTELDGVEVLTGVFVFAATSRPDLLDAALLRPGRLDRLLFCDFPSQQERFDILKVLSRKLPMASDVDLETISYMTEGFSGADLQALLSDAQLEAVHELLERGENGTANREKPVINNALLKTIAAKAKPSVSEAEKQRLYDIYNQFLDSKKSMAAQSRDTKGKRATLA